MLKLHLLVPLALLAAAPTAAHANDLGALCTFAKTAPADDQLALAAIKSQLWQEMDCDLPIENAYPDRYDAHVLVHVGRIISTFGADATADTMERYRSEASRVAYSISKLDRARFDREIAKAPASARKQLGAAFELAALQAKQVHAWRSKQVKATAKAVWQTGWDQAIASVDGDWTAYGTDIKLALDALAKASEGERCPDVQGRLSAVVKQAAPGTREQLDAFTHRLDVELLIGATMRCAAAGNDTKLAALLGNLSEQLHLPSHYAGPSARVATLLHARYQEAHDRGTARDVIEPSMGAGWMAELGSVARLDDYWGTKSDGKGGGLVENAVYGEVTASKPSRTKGMVTVSFKKVVVTDRALLCKEGTRVVRIDEDGRLEYERSCTWGKPFKVDVSAYPVDVPAKLATQIKPGNFVFIAEIENGQAKTDHRLGLPLELYRDRSKQQLVGFLGVAY